MFIYLYVRPSAGGRIATLRDIGNSGGPLMGGPGGAPPSSGDFGRGGPPQGDDDEEDEEEESKQGESWYTGGERRCVILSTAIHSFDRS